MRSHEHPGWEALWAATGRWVEAALGLHFPARLAPDLQRGMEAAARRLGLQDGPACAHRALAGQLSEAELEVVAECLAIGETYFFRDPGLFQALAQHVLEPLIAARRGSSRHLRLWSAGCSSGEEAWSLAMLVASLLPDWRDWDFLVLGTDLNAAALRKARTATYGRWSLRGPIAPQFHQFLQPGADGRRHVHPALRARVRFERLNLAGPHYPSAATRTTELDLVLCRNVLIYFEAARARTVLERLGRCLAPDGWLVTGSVELPATAIPGLSLVRADGLIALRRSTSMAVPAAAPPAPAGPVAPPRAERITGAPGGPPAAAAATATPAAAARAVLAPSTADLLEQARRHADAGDLVRAERLCRQAMERDKLDPACPYLLATVLTERGAIAEAMAALQRTLYLEPDHLPARFSLGTLALQQGQRQTGRRHLANALVRLAQRPAGDIVQGSGGLTARELRAAIRSAEEAAG